MTPDEQATLDDANERADIATRATAILTGMNEAGNNWIDRADAANAIQLRARRQEDGTFLFESDTPNEDKTTRLVSATEAAKELAKRKLHWTRATLTPGTAAPGHVAKSPSDTTTYAELLKPQNSAKLKTWIENKPAALARLRSIHFQG